MVEQLLDLVHHLEDKVALLEEELILANERLEVCRNNLSVREKQLSQETQYRYFITKRIPKWQMNLISVDWYSCKPLGQEFSDKEGECIDVANHKRREVYGED